MAKIWSQKTTISRRFGIYSFQYDPLNLGGSGMAITGDPINLPGCQGQVTASDFANECSNCNACIQSHPCTECQYWPIYPCYSPKVCIS